MDGKSIITGNQGQGLSCALSASCPPAFFALLSRGTMSDRAAWGCVTRVGSGIWAKLPTGPLAASPSPRGPGGGSDPVAATGMDLPHVRALQMGGRC